MSRVALSADIDSQFPKEPVYGFGIVSLAIISYTDNGGAETGQYGFAVMAVYPDSPMARRVSGAERSSTRSMDSGSLPGT